MLGPQREEDMLSFVIPLPWFGTDPLNIIVQLRFKAIHGKFPEILKSKSPTPSRP